MTATREELADALELLRFQRDADREEHEHHYRTLESICDALYEKLEAVNERLKILDKIEALVVDDPRFKKQKTLTDS